MEEYHRLKQDIFDLSRSFRLFSRLCPVRTTALHLTEDEKTAREEWNQERERLVSRFNALRGIPQENSITSLLDCVVLPPKFTEYGEAARSTVNKKRATRYYPTVLHDYSNEFNDIVANYAPTNRSINHPTKTLQDSIGAGKFYFRDEKHEEAFLLNIVWDNLETFGFTLSAEGLKRAAPNADIKPEGFPDYLTYAPSVLENVDAATRARIFPSAIFEVKSFHNLLLPNSFDGENGIQAHYNLGLASISNAENPKRNAEWARVAHPIGQTLGYMVDNHCQYGALCCASKTYFLHINESHQCMITKAYFTSDENFFKAWAAFLNEADQNYNGERLFTDPPGVERTLEEWDWKPEMPNLERLPDGRNNGRHGPGAPGPGGRGPGGRGPGAPGPGGQSAGEPSVPGHRYPTSTTRKRKRRKKSRTAHPDENETPTVHPLLSNYSTLSPLAQQQLYDFELDFVPFVPETQLEFHGELGGGRTGCVYKATWNGTAVAVKKFDLCKKVDAYEKEVEAYKFLRGAWGKHVPTPYFVSRSLSGQIAYLGMTLGNEVSDKQWEAKGEKYWERFLHHVRILERDFDFRHLDVWENLRVRNYIVVGNDDVLAIDLEAWERANGIVGKV